MSDEVKITQPTNPDWSKLPPFEEMVHIAFGEHGVIRSKDHPIYQKLLGIKPEGPDKDARRRGD